MSFLENKTCRKICDFVPLSPDEILYDRFMYPEIMFRGEIFHCQKCGECYLAEFEDGPGYVSISKSDYEEQIELSQKYFPSYDAKKYGYYYHHFAFCEHCAKNISNKIFEDGHIILKYFKKLEEASEFKQQLITKIKNKLNKNLEKETLDELNHEAFVELKASHHCGVKENKRRFAQIFVEKSKDKIPDYLTYLFYTDTEWLKIQDEVLALSKDVHNLFDSPKYKYNIRVFIELDLENECIGELRCKLPAFEKYRTDIVTINPEVKFYQLCKFSKADIRKKYMEMSKLFNPLDICDKNYIDYICKRLPNIMAKANIWD